MAQVGFVVSLNGALIAPTPFENAQAAKFCADNSRFLAGHESAEVYWNAKQTINAGNSLTANNSVSATNSIFGNQSQQSSTLGNDPPDPQSKRNGGSKLPQPRNVVPQQGAPYQQAPATAENLQQYSKVNVSEAEFSQLIGDDNDGTLARFVDNKLNVLFWVAPAGGPATGLWRQARFTPSRRVPSTAASAGGILPAKRCLPRLAGRFRQTGGAFGSPLSSAVEAAFCRDGNR